MTGPNRKLVLGVIIILFGLLSCTLTQSISTQVLSTSTVLLPTSTKPETTTVTGPDGMLLTLEGEALSGVSNIQLEVLGEGEAVWESTPFEAASLEYRVGFGEAEQVGGITLSVPLLSLDATASLESAPVASHAYAAWVQPEQGSPSLVGVITEQDMARFPVVGAGKYQVVRILSAQALAQLVDLKDPLSVPSYPQMTPSWCSPTALTNLAGYHEGAWPVGGTGSLWGESSNWWLAGKAGQPYNSGYFFHWLLAAGGYTAPENVKESFSNGNAEVFIWNWKAAKIDTFWLDFSELFGFDEFYLQQKMDYAQSLFDFFQAYVESNLWGQNGSRRPVAWGSSLAGHSRTITGSDGINLFYNDPSSGAWNLPKSWETYRQEVMDSISATAAKTEIIDTAVFYADPRPASERRAVLWLWQKNDSQDGSIILRRGASGDPEAYWIWDGDLLHELGYYYQDVMGDLPVDPYLNVKFKAFTVFDKVEYSYSIRSISDGSYEYRVHTELFYITGSEIPIESPDQVVTVGAGERVDIFPAGSFPIVDLVDNLHYIKFTLSQDGIVQDVKYVFFVVAPNDVVRMHMAIVKSPAFCREGPGSIYEVVTGFDAGQELRLVGLNPDKSWGKFEASMNGFTFQCWVSLALVDTKGFMDVPILVVPATPTVVTPVNACSQYSTPQICATHPECTWNRLVTPGVCQAR